MLTRVGTTKRWSDAVIFNNTIYLVEVPSTLSDSLRDQSIELLNLVEKALVQYGSDKKHMISVTIYLRDISQIDIFNEVWDSWIPFGCAPVRACVEAKLAHSDYQVEVQVVAAQIDKNKHAVPFMT